MQSTDNFFFFILRGGCALGFGASVPDRGRTNDYAAPTTRNDGNDKRVEHTYLMMSKNMAQKHMSTASTDSMLENSATDTSMAVIATNIAATVVENVHRVRSTRPVKATRAHGSTATGRAADLVHVRRDRRDEETRPQAT